MNTIEIYKSLLSKSKTEKLSEILPDFNYLAEKLSEKEMKKWGELEYNGYFNSNPIMDEKTEVPEYRTVPGVFKDFSDRPLYIEDPDLAFVNTIRLRQGIAELEDLSEKNGVLEIFDSNLTELIQKYLKVKVHKFTFSSSSVKSILSSVRAKFINNLISMESNINGINSEIKNEDILLDIDTLHPKIQEVAGELFKSGYFRQAVLDTYIMLVDYVKTKSGIHDLDNTPLMQKVFSQNKPIIKVSDDKDEQLGFMWMFSGAVMGIRNPNSHRLIDHNDRQKTFEWLCFASVLLRTLDDAK